MGAKAKTENPDSAFHQVRLALSHPAVAAGAVYNHISSKTARFTPLDHTTFGLNSEAEMSESNLQKCG